MLCLRIWITLFFWNSRNSFLLVFLWAWFLIWAALVGFLFLVVLEIPQEFFIYHITRWVCSLFTFSCMTILVLANCFKNFPFVPVLSHTLAILSICKYILSILFIWIYLWDSLWFVLCHLYFLDNILQFIELACWLWVVVCLTLWLKWLNKG